MKQNTKKPVKNQGVKAAGKGQAASIKKSMDKHFRKEKIVQKDGLTYDSNRWTMTKTSFGYIASPKK